VRASWPSSKDIYAFPLYLKNSHGDRGRGKIKFKKNNGDEINNIKPQNSRIVYCARKLYKKIYHRIPKEWQKLGDALETIVGINNLAIIGSWLLGFEGKDVDYALYGLDSLDKFSQKYRLRQD